MTNKSKQHLAKDIVQKMDSLRSQISKRLDYIYIEDTDMYSYLDKELKFLDNKLRLFADEYSRILLKSDFKHPYLTKFRNLEEKKRRLLSKI